MLHQILQPAHIWHEFEILRCRLWLVDALRSELARHALALSPAHEVRAALRNDAQTGHEKGTFNFVLVPQASAEISTGMPRWLQILSPVCQRNGMSESITLITSV